MAIRIPPKTNKDAVDTTAAVKAASPAEAGTAAMLEAGTDTTPRMFSAADINAEIARQIAAIPAA